MVSYIPPPNPRELLPPLLACLPTAFVSPKPPPALLGLLTPILKQRVHLNTSLGPTTDSWLKLLSWNAERANKLPEIIEEIHLEPHPVSGEIELEDVETIQYRRLDPETLQSRLVLEEIGLLPLYLWCLGDGQGNETGWKLAELRGKEDQDDGTEWFDSIDEANESSGAPRPAPVQSVGQANGSNGSNGHSSPPKTEEKGAGEEEDDSDYWASYDQVEGRTPKNRSPAPPPQTSTVQAPSASELEYFARYMSEAQSQVDPSGPPDEALPVGESTLNGNTIIPETRQPQHEQLETSDNYSLPPAQNGNGVPEALLQPRPSSSNSSLNSTERLERKAEVLTQAEVGIKQHISTDIKSLFRLARSAGIPIDEFKRIVTTELDVLAMMDMDE